MATTSVLSVNAARTAASGSNIAPVRRHLSVVAVSDEVPQCGIGLLRVVGALVVLDAVDHDAAVVFRE